MYTPTDTHAAHDAWGANCGPGAIAAAFGVEVGAVRAAVSKRGRFAGYMGVADVQRACAELGRAITRSSSKPGEIEAWPRDETHLAMIAVDGPWRHDPHAAARRRHLVAVRRHVWFEAALPELWKIYDVNAGAGEWIGSKPWARWVMDRLAADQRIYPGSTGRWLITWRGTLGAAS